MNDEIDLSSAEAFERFKGAGVYADLMLDHTFKKAFDPDSPNGTCLILLLNALFEDEIGAPIREIRSRDKELRGRSHENRATIFDLHCIDDRGRKFIVEVQLAKQENIVNRAIYYAAQTIANFGERGRGFSYGISPVVTAVFMDFEIFDDSPECVHLAKLREKNGKSIGETLTFAFVELPKFKKGLGDLKTTLDKGLFLLKHIKELRKIPESYAGSGFEPLFSSAELARLTKEELKMIDYEQMRKWDEYAIRKYNRNVRKNALNEGRTEGLAEGHAKGLAEGRAEGIKAGRKDGLRETALAMLRDNLPIEKIVLYSGLSEKEIREL